MITWGVLSGAMAFIHGETSFYVVRVPPRRFAEAGFFPGIIFLSHPLVPCGAYRARILGLLHGRHPALLRPRLCPSPAPCSGMDGWIAGMHGWQWLYIIEAAPALLLSFVVLAYLTDSPADAGWLPPDERAWLIDRLALERRQREASRRFTVMQALLDPKVIAVSFVYFGAVACLYGLSFFLPTIVKGFGMTNLQTGFVTAIPYVVGTVGMIWWGGRSDRKQERKGHAVIALILAAGGIAVSTLLPDPVEKMIALSVASFGIFASLPVIWTLPTAYLSGAAAAGGIAVVNSIGNLSGFFGPSAMGYIKDHTGSFNGGLWTLAAAGFLGAAIVALLRHDSRLEQAPLPGALPAE